MGRRRSAARVPDDGFVPCLLLRGREASCVRTIDEESIADAHQMRVRRCALMLLVSGPTEVHDIVEFAQLHLVPLSNRAAGKDRVLEASAIWRGDFRPQGERAVAGGHCKLIREVHLQGHQALLTVDHAVRQPKELDAAKAFDLLAKFEIGHYVGPEVHTGPGAVNESTGMPRPLSFTETEPSACTRISMRSQWPPAHVFVGPRNVPLQPREV